MPTVRYVNPVTGPYLTPQAAHDAASYGDTILLAPGTHPRVVGNKLVHFKGDTTDPIGNPVLIAGGGDFQGQSLSWTVGNGFSGDWWFEGVTFGYGSGNVNGAMKFSGTWPSALRMRLNRCIFSGETETYSSTGIKIRAENSRQVYGGLRSSLLYLTGVKANEIELFSCQTLQKPPTFYLSYGSGPSSWAIYHEDVVTAATAGYGPGYGTWYAPQWQGAAYRVYGEARLPSGVDRSLSRIRLYREINGTIELSPWMMRTPHPVTGAWSFDYLPTDQRFWVATIPPSGYRPQWDGPFVPGT